MDIDISLSKDSVRSSLAQDMVTNRDSLVCRDYTRMRSCDTLGFIFLGADHYPSAGRAISQKSRLICVRRSNHCVVSAVITDADCLQFDFSNTYILHTCMYVLGKL